MTPTMGAAFVSFMVVEAKFIPPVLSGSGKMILVERPAFWRSLWRVGTKTSNCPADQRQAS
jgi:hypothetical protein